jgi:WD40 repeat protein
VEGEGGEPPARKRRLVGGADVSPPLRFRHLGFVTQSQAACLMFVFEHSVSNDVEQMPLSALPREVVELIGRQIVVGTGGLVRFKNPERLECAATLPGNLGVVQALEYFTLADGRQFLASGSGDCTVKLWDLCSRECAATFEGHTGRVRSLASFSDGDRTFLASGCGDGTIVVWDVAGHNELFRLSGHRGFVRTLAAFPSPRASPGHPCLASGGYDGNIMLWDMHERSMSAVLSGHAGGVLSLFVFRDDSGADFIVSGSKDRTIKVWDLTTNELVSTLSGHTRVVTGVTGFSGEHGTVLVSFSFDGTLRIWDLASCETVAVLDVLGVSKSASLFLACVAGVDGRVLACTSGFDWFRLVDTSMHRTVFEAALMGTDSCVAFVDHASGAPFFAVSYNSDEGGFIKLFGET